MRSFFYTFLSLFFALALLVFSPKTAFAQTVTVFSDNVENGLNGWVAAGTDQSSSSAGLSLWHQTNRQFNSPITAWYYGQESTGNYDTGSRNSGTLTSPSISLSGVDNPSLRFYQFLKTENQTSPPSVYDRAAVEVTRDGGITWDTVATFSSSQNGWEQAFVSLNAYLGDTIQVRFAFDTLDNVSNAFEGWYVDDITITGESVAPPLVCDAPAQVSLSNSSTPLMHPGETTNNEFVIYNPNPSECGYTQYGISRSYPSGWTLTPTALAVFVAGGETKNIPFTLTSSSTTVPGTYEYTLYANGGYGATGKVAIELKNTAPIANAGSDKNGFTNESINFDGSASSDAEGTISYHWNFGDGASATEVKPSHVYSQPGTYTAVLTVTDQEGLTSQDTQTVVITNDTVTITKAVYINSEKSLSVQATSSSNGKATLTVPGIGQMTYNSSNGMYELMVYGKYKSPISVESSFNGSATSSVERTAK